MAWIAVGQGPRTASAIEQQVVDGCVACHNGPLGFGEREAADLEAILAAMAAGERSHPAPLPPLSDEERRELAEALAGN